MEPEQSQTEDQNPSPSEDQEQPSPLYFTVDDDGFVLELVKEEEPSGIFVRQEKEWIEITEEDEFPTVYGQIVLYANDQSVGAWDAELEANEQLKQSDLDQYLV